MASTAASTERENFPSSFSSMKYQYPPVFKDFLIRLAKSLDSENRAAFQFWCKGLLPGSMLDGDITTDAEFFALIDSLLNSNELSLTNMKVLKDILSSIGRMDLLQELKKVKLRISIGIILEDYLKFKSVDGFRQGTPMKSPENHRNIVKLLLTTKKENRDLITEVLGQLKPLCSDQNCLKKFKNIALIGSKLSWPMITSSLVIIGELYALLTPQSRIFEGGSCVYLFSKTKTSDLLSDWMFENGGLKMYNEFISKKQRATISESVPSSHGESLKDKIELLGSRVGLPLRN
nr:uncharacterized protein LOC131774898 [Pocillopora verrucosa]